MKKFKHKGICMILVMIILAVGYVFGFKHINAEFPTDDVRIYKEGAIAEYNGLKIKVISGEVLTTDDIYNKYGYDMREDDIQDINNMVVWVEVENTLNTDNKIDIMGFTGLKGLWSNGNDLYAVWGLNGDDFSAELAPGETKKIGSVFVINSDIKELLNENTEWRLRISEWPNRMEFVVPVQISEGVSAS